MVMSMRGPALEAAGTTGCRSCSAAVCCSFFFQAEDGIRDYKVTGVQTCALPISDILIGAERQAYDRTAAAEGGWRGERAFVVEDKVAESAEITSFYLVPADGGPVIAHQPGQYIGLRLVVDGQEQRRN